jgi:hypothetical protein
MNPEAPPLVLAARFKQRRKEKPTPIMLSSQAVSQRAATAARLQGELGKVQQKLQQLTPQQKRAVFLKLSHERLLTPRDLSNTDLRLISSPSEHCSLVIPTNDDADLSSLSERIREFGHDPIPPKRNPKNSTLATNLQTIAIGEPIDRLSDELFKNYKRLIKRTFLKLEIEISSFEISPNSPKKRREEIERIINQIRGLIGTRGAVYEIDYSFDAARASIGVPGAIFRDLVERTEWQRVITFFEARPQFETLSSMTEQLNVSKQEVLSPPNDAPTVCIIDSGISSGNPYLAKVVKTNLLKSFLPGKENDPSDQYGHGSGVASLASYYAIDITAEAKNQAKIWVAGARILNDNGQLDAPEPDDFDIEIDAYRAQQARLLSKVLREVVEYFVPHGIRIFVLSFNIINRLWNQDGRRTIPRTSWVARTIDQLAQEKDIVFITITGNLEKAEIEALIKDHAYPKYLLDMRARLQDPGHSALSITVGSLSHSTKVVGRANGHPMSQVGQPSPFTRSGPSITGGVKPDFVERGGNILLDQPNASVSRNQGTDVIMASHQLSPPISFARGTSFAAPRVAHHLALILQDLGRLGIVRPSAQLLRAFLGSSARWTDPMDMRWLDTQLPEKSWLAVVGLGLPDSARATHCDKNVVILYFDGHIKPNQVAFFDICVPHALVNTGRQRKSLTVSLAYAPAIQRRGLDEYLGTRLKFRLFRGNTDPSKIEEWMGIEEDEENTPRQNDGHLPGTLGINLRSKGTLQQDRFEWFDHDRAWSAYTYTLAISASAAKWSAAGEPISMAIVVRLEVEDQNVINLYSEVATVMARTEAPARA